MAGDDDVPSNNPPSPPPNTTTFHPAFAISNIKNHVTVSLGHYAKWAELFRDTAYVYNVLDHIDPKVPRPKDIDYATWMRLDAIVKRWIYDTVSNDLVRKITKSDATALDLWTGLENMFHDNNVNEMEDIEVGGLSPEDKAGMFEEIKWDLEQGEYTPGYLLRQADCYECIPQLLELQEAAYLIPYYDLFIEIKRLILLDDKDKFASFLAANHELLQSYPPDQVLYLLCSHCVVGCLAAFLESRLDFDINAVDSSGRSPLHIAASHLSYAMTELLLQHGADSELHSDDYHTPLRTALKEIRYVRLIWTDWNDETSILKLLHYYCLPQRKEPLDVIRLLAMASDTKKVDDLLKELMNYGRVQEYAALLMVCWDKIMVSNSDSDSESNSSPTLAPIVLDSDSDSDSESNSSPTPTPNKGRDLVNTTPVWQYIIRVLNNESLQQEICKRFKFRSKEKLVKNLTIALDVVKTMWRTIGVLERYYHQTSEIRQLKGNDLSFQVTYELVKNARVDLKPYRAYNLPCLLSKLASEATGLPDQKYSMESRQSSPFLSSFVGKPGTSSFETPLLSPMSRIQYRRLNILNPMTKHLSKTGHVKPSSNNVLALGKVCAPLMWFAKRRVK